MRPALAHKRWSESGPHDKWSTTSHLLRSYRSALAKYLEYDHIIHIVRWYDVWFDTLRGGRLSDEEMGMIAPGLEMDAWCRRRVYSRIAETVREVMSDPLIVARVDRAISVLAKKEKEKKEKGGESGGSTGGSGDGAEGKRGVDADDQGGSDASDGTGSSGLGEVSNSDGDCVAPHNHSGAKGQSSRNDACRSNTGQGVSASLCDPGPQDSGDKPQEGESPVTGSTCDDTPSQLSDAPERDPARDDGVRDDAVRHDEKNGGREAGSPAPMAEVNAAGHQDLVDVMYNPGDDPETLSQDGDNKRRHDTSSSRGSVPSHGGWHANRAVSERIARKADKRQTRRVRSALRRLIKNYKMGVDGDPSPRVCPRALVREMAIKRVSLSRAKREEMDKRDILILVDVSGSMSCYCTELLAAALAISEQMDGVSVVEHSNGFRGPEYAFSGDIKIEDHSDQTIGAINLETIGLVVALGDGDAYAHYVDMAKRADMMVMLDAYASSWGPKSASHNLLGWYSELVECGVIVWQGVSDGDSVADALDGILATSERRR